MPPPPKMRSFILALQDGKVRRIKIPATWKLTFGSLVPYVQKANAAPYGNHTPALRIYEGNKENLRAVMTDVSAFWDESVIIQNGERKTVYQTAKVPTKKGMVDVEIIPADGFDWEVPITELAAEKL